jgi:glucokinase
MQKVCWILAIDIGGHWLKGGLVDPITGDKLFCQQVESGARSGARKVAENFCSFAAKLLAIAKEKNMRVVSIGYGTPGTVNAETGIVSGSCGNIAGWIGYDLPSEVRRQFGLPVFSLNDVRCFTLCEATFGAGVGMTDFGVWAFGTGVGGGLWLLGKLYLGVRYSACELGHLPIDPLGPSCSQGHRGCLEGFTSTEAIKTLWTTCYNSRGNLETSYHEVKKPIVVDIFKHAEANDPLCRKVTDMIAFRIAKGIGIVANILDLQIGIIGGKVAGSEQFFADEVQKQVMPHLLDSQHDFRIVRAKYHDQGAMLGAAVYAHQRYLKSLGTPD